VPADGVEAENEIFEQGPWSAHVRAGAGHGVPAPSAREHPCGPHDNISLDPGCRGDLFRREAVDGASRHVHVSCLVADEVGVVKTLGNDHSDHRRQDGDVVTRPRSNPW
jgi:hypothetical protein